MPLIAPAPLPYDPEEWAQKPLEERGRMVCQVWALRGYGAPHAVYILYALKLLGYVAGWLFFCSCSPSLGGPATLADWWLAPLAFQKAILWSMLFEGLGLGCGSGPLSGRYLPPIGGVLYFARPGTTKLPLLGGWPVFGGTRRSLLDVALYLALVAALLRALLAPALAPALLWPIALLLPLLSLGDKTMFLAFRGEHYWTTVMCFVLADDWISGAMAVQLALWFWAGVSKLNHHFPAVVCVMISNSPLLRCAWLRRLFYRHYPDDLRPSRVAELAAHAGTGLELGIPLVLVFGSGSASLQVALVMVLLLHGFITSNVPAGVPLEWNVMVVYGAFALFWAHPEVSAFAPGSVALAGLLVALLIGLPLFGNLFPERLSFLLSMRYYAGNWAASVWLLRGESYRKLERLTKSSPWVYDQLGRFYDRVTSVGLLGMLMAFRLMHLHGRCLPRLIPRAVPRLQDYQYLDGEVVAGLALGWNFGDGHLHHEQLLAAVQAQCGFAPGELRCVFVESQPLGRARLRYRICDAATGQLERGELSIAELRQHQPWTAGHAPA
jgi:Transmembrane protein of unknown function (DUF3556)